MTSPRVPVSFWVGLIVVAIIAALALVGGILWLRGEAATGGVVAPRSAGAGKG